MDSHDVRQRWAERSGEYSPGYYAYYGPNETSEAVGSLLERVVGRQGRILEVGCSSGRHLAHLNDEGFERLHGVEINAAARDVMRENFPDLADNVTFHLDAVGDVVGEFEDGAFDAVFSVQTLQHIHPDDTEVFDEIARVTGQLLVTVENEGHSADRDDGDRVDSNRVDSNLIDGKSVDSNLIDGKSVDGNHDTGDRDVTFVDDGVPLFHRDWNRVFTGRGFEEIESRTLDKVTMRAFRSAGC